MFLSENNTDLADGNRMLRRAFVIIYYAQDSEMSSATLRRVYRILAHGRDKITVAKPGVSNRTRLGPARARVQHYGTRRAWLVHYFNQIQQFCDKTKTCISHRPCLSHAYNAEANHNFLHNYVVWQSEGWRFDSTPGKSMCPWARHGQDT